MDRRGGGALGGYYKRQELLKWGRGGLNTILLAWNLVNTSLLSERGIDAVDPNTLGSVGHLVVEAGTSMLEAGAAALSDLLPGRLGRRSSGLLVISGLRSRLSYRDLVLDSGLHALLLGGL